MTENNPNPTSPPSPGTSQPLVASWWRHKIVISYNLWCHISYPTPVNTLQISHHFICLKLTLTNYLFGKKQLIPFLCGQNLSRYVDDTLLCSAPDGQSVVANLAVQAWVLYKSSILSMFISSLSDEVMYIANWCRTCHIMASVASYWPCIWISTSWARSLSLLC